MRNLILLLTIALHVPALAIDAYFNSAVFYHPDNGTYIETQMLFRGSSLRFAMTEGGFQSEVELTYIFKQHDKVVDYSKKIVRSPITSDSVTAVVDYLDVQRFSLPAGTYELSIKLRDRLNPIDTGELLHSITIYPPNEQAYFSDVVFIDTLYPSGERTTAFTRGNFEMIPRISGFQGPDRKKAIVYAELYQSEISLGGKDDYLITFDIINVKTDEPISPYRSFARHKGSELQPVLQTWNIEDLPTGSYLVKMEARNRFNEVFAAQSKVMQRHSLAPASDSMNSSTLNKTFVGEINKEDSLRNMIYCMRYQGNAFESKYIDENWQEGDTTELKRFMYNFWRDRNAIDPESAWKRYHDRITYVEDEFGLGNRRRHACATDRGRVYLAYGKPKTRVIQAREPGAYPYEIWHYYATPKKQDAKFVFYDKTTVTNDYVLLNSNVPGEPVDYSWYLRLATPQYDPSGNDESMVGNDVSDINNLKGVNQNQVGSRALDYWNNPR